MLIFKKGEAKKEEKWKWIKKKIEEVKDYVFRISSSKNQSSDIDL